MPHAFDLAAAAPQDAQVFAALSGRQPRKLAIVTTRLLHEAHADILKAVQAPC